ATAAAPNDVQVQLAYLRALVGAGLQRQVGRQAMVQKKLALASGRTSLVFAEILTHDAMPAVHAILCEEALAKAEAGGVDGRQLSALRYVVQARCAEDAKAAKATMDDYVQHLNSTINDDCWYFMTRLPTMGRFDWFAAALADRMLEDRPNMGYHEFDTAALAKFLAGKVGEAVELQETSIRQGAQGNAEYAERLERYRKIAAEQAAEPKAKAGR
ncbi:MAG: hypothetical protein KDC98_03055, partial [Planctomycetes bacterium]|nr:hypothetical protein [Planctomycetota bacterium]